MSGSRIRWIVATLTTALLVVGAPAPARAAVGQLDTVPLATLGGNGEARDINDRGVVLGSAIAAGERHVLLWRPGRPVLDLGPGNPVAINNHDDLLVDGQLTHPAREVTLIGLNDRGQVIGSLWGGDGGPDTVFRWQDGRFTELAGPAGTIGFAIDINERGDVLGMLIDRDFTRSRGVVWSRGVRTIFGGGVDFTPHAINERGDVVGEGQVGDPPVSHPFLWRNGRLTDLMAGRPGESGTAADLNDAGDIAGSVANSPTLWRGGRAIDVGPPGYSGRATVVNERGQVGGVVGRATSDEDREVRAFRWAAGRVSISASSDPDGSISIAGMDERGRMAGTVTDGAAGHEVPVRWR